MSHDVGDQLLRAAFFVFALALTTFLFYGFRWWWRRRKLLREFTAAVDEGQLHIAYHRDDHFMGGGWDAVYDGRADLHFFRFEVRYRAFEDRKCCSLEIYVGLTKEGKRRSVRYVQADLPQHDEKHAFSKLHALIEKRHRERQARLKRRKAR